MTTTSAKEILTFSNKKASDLVKGVLDSAIANAEHNDGADIDELKVSAIMVDAGPTEFASVYPQTGILPGMPTAMTTPTI